MSNPINQPPDESLDQIKEKLQTLTPEEIKDVDLFVKFLCIRQTPWKRAMVGFVFNALLLIPLPIRVR